MKLYNIKNVDEFLGVVERCKGKVEIKTSDGSTYNAKSKLSQFNALVKLFSNGAVKEIDLKIEDPIDTHRFLNYLVAG